MNLSDVPIVQAALADVLPLIPPIWRGFDEATTEARATIDSFHLAKEGKIATFGDDTDTHSRVYDRYLFPHLVRYLERLYLTNLTGYSLSVEEIQADNIAMSGLRLRYGKRVIHIRKATPDGGVPDPGDSQPTRAYYQTILSQEFAGTGVDLLLLWHANPYGMYKGLSVVCAVPGKRALTRRMLGLIHMPDPAETDLYTAAMQVPPVTMPDTAVYTETLGDLPIEPLTAETEDEIGQDDTEQAE